MADNGPSNERLSPSGEDSPVRDRREFFKRAALVGLPVALATVRAQTAWGQTTNPNDTVSCRASLGTSGCKARNGLLG